MSAAKRITGFNVHTWQEGDRMWGLSVQVDGAPMRHKLCNELYFTAGDALGAAQDILDELTAGGGR